MREVMTGAAGRSPGQRQPTGLARALDDQNEMNFGFWRFRAPGTMCTGRGTRASANTSGSDFTRTKTVGEIADRQIRTVRRKTVSSAGPVFDGSKPFETTIRPFDLMSRRHPLSSTRALRPHQLRKANCSEGSRDVPASSRRQFFRRELSLLLGDLAGLLRSLLHCALRLLCLLSFLGHVALLSE
jgi:hypothetical protein